VTVASIDGAARAGWARDLLAVQLGLDPAVLVPEARLVDDLGLDSIGMTIFLAALEDAGVHVGEAAVAGLERVADVAALLERRAGLPLRSAAAAASSVALRPVLEADLDYLYGLATSLDTGWRWRLRGTTPSPEEFRRLLWERVLVQYVVTAGGGDRIGLVQADRLHRNGYAFLTALFEERAQLHGRAMQAVAQFVDSVFDTWDLERLFAEVPGFNYPLLESGAGRFFEVCGVLPEHDFARGRYWDLYLLVIDRRRWEREARAVLGVAGEAGRTP
jgi:acyl carrier protein/RimJ/RimL family protein N-acetyltransferase